MSDIRKAEAKDAPEFEAKVEAMIEAKDAPKVKDEVEAKNEKPWNVNGKMLPVVPFTGKTYFFPSHFPGVEHFTAYCMNAVVKFGVSDELKELLDDCDVRIPFQHHKLGLFSFINTTTWANSSV